MRSRRLLPPKGKYLESRAAVRVRFQEVDALHVVWHGHYLAYLEDARVDFGRAYGLRYEDIRAAGLMAPVVSLACNYLQPAWFDDRLEVVTRLYQRETATIEFYYEIRRAEGWENGDKPLLSRGGLSPFSRPFSLLAVAQTTQAFADEQGVLMLTMPPLLRDFYARWEGSMRSSDE